MKKFMFLMVLLSFFFAVSCGDDKKESNDSEVVTDDQYVPDEDIEAEDDAVNDDAVTEEENEIDEITDEEAGPITCADVAEGMNKKFMAGSGETALERDFIVRLAQNVDSKEGWPVVFLFR
ncbi:MAG TPA: hypothetical protein P5044_11835 [bacterium]|nr:hypothetical protein [bacterium]